MSVMGQLCLPDGCCDQLQQVLRNWSMNTIRQGCLDTSRERTMQLTANLREYCKSAAAKRCNFNSDDSGLCGGLIVNMLLNRRVETSTSSRMSESCLYKTGDQHVGQQLNTKSPANCRCGLAWSPPCIWYR